MIDGTLARSWLFTPGDRPDRFDPGRNGRFIRPDVVILDLEDAVAPDGKDAARDAVARHLAGDGRAWVRVNGADTPYWDDDVTTLTGLPGLAGVVLPKAEDADTVATTAARLDVPVLALVETATGVERAGDVARGSHRLALGPVDLMTALGVDDQDALLHARSRLVFASAAARLPGPVDGPTTALDDDEALDADLARGRRLGFTGAFCLHPRQVGRVDAAHTPADDAVQRARRIVTATEEAGGGDGRVVRVDGRMVDRPVLAAARAVLARADAFTPKEPS